MTFASALKDKEKKQVPEQIWFVFWLCILKNSLRVFLLPDELNVWTKKKHTYR